MDGGSKEKRIKWMETFDGKYQLQNLPYMKNSIDTIVIEYFLQPYGKFDFICDIGSGLGHYIHYLKEKIGTPNCRVIGYDVSMDNCIKAKSEFPDIEFQVKNFIIKNDNFIDSSVYQNKLFISREVVKYLWYDLDDFIYNLNLLIPPSKLFILSNNLPTQTREQYDFDMAHEWGIKDLNMLIKKIEKYFTLLRIIIQEEHEIIRPSQGQFIALFRRNK